MQETTHIRHLQIFFFSLDWAMATVSTSSRTTLATAARKGINLHLAKNLGVPVRKSHLALPLPSSGQAQGVQSDPTAPEHQEHGKRTVRNRHVLIKSWAGAEWVPSSSSELRESCAELEPGAGPDPQGLSQGAQTVGLQTQPLPLWKSHRLSRSQFFL